MPLYVLDRASIGQRDSDQHCGAHWTEIDRHSPAVGFERAEYPQSNWFNSAVHTVNLAQLRPGVLPFR